MKEDLKVTMERFEYFIQEVLKPYKEPPMLLVMFKEGCDVKIVKPINNNLEDFKLYCIGCIASFKPNQGFMCIPCADEKYDALLGMRHEGSLMLRSWCHKIGEPLDQGWEGIISNE